VSADLPTERRAPLWWVLVRHEWRLTMRDFGGGAMFRGINKDKKPIGQKRLIFGYVAAAVLLHCAGALALVFPRTWSDTQGTRIAAVAVLAFLFTLMLSSAMSRVVSAFHERRDLDLLLSAPIAPALILVLRALTIVATVSALYAIFVYPLADVGVATRHWWMAKLYPLVPLMALTSTAVALALTGAVVRLVGVRRARVGLQIFSALIGASFYLVSQAQQFLPKSVASAAMAWMKDATRDGEAAWPVVAAARLAGGDPWAWIAFVFGAVGLFAASVWSARKRFVDVAQQPEADAVVVAPARGKVERRLQTGFARKTFATLLVKEWRLILRSPQLISQILLQMLYMMPLMFVAFGHQGAGLSWGPAAFAAGIVALAGTLTASLAWLTVSAEDAPDLMAGSPKSRAMILASKLFAATAPTVVILVVAAVGTSRRSIVEALIVLVFGTLACVSAAILEAATPSPGKRSDFQRRHKGNGLSAIIDGFQFLLWAGAAGTAASGWWIAAVALVVIACIVPGLRLPRALSQAR
jgi:ABC-2 type transport system permease protein